MSESSDPYEHYKCKTCGSLMGRDADCPVCDEEGNQPPAVGLTEEDIKGAAQALLCFALVLGGKHSYRDDAERAEVAEDVRQLSVKLAAVSIFRDAAAKAAGDANADVVSVRREVPEHVKPCCHYDEAIGRFAFHPDYRIFFPENLREVADYLDGLQAEAEAALAAKGGA